MTVDLSATIDAALAAFGETVSYTPKGVAAITGLTAIRGEMNASLQTPEGLAVDEGDISFEIKRADLQTAGGAAVEPAYQDLVTDADGNAYDVQTKSLDSARLAWKVFCKRRT